MAKYQTFDEYIKGEKIIRYHPSFKRCWDFATETAEEKFTSTNTQSTKLLSRLEEILSHARWNSTCNHAECIEIIQQLRALS